MLCIGAVFMFFRKAPFGRASAAVVVLAMMFVAAPHAEAADWQQWRPLPVLDRGRQKPLDTMARETLRTITGRSSVVDPESGETLDATAAYLTMLFDWQADKPATAAGKSPHGAAGKSPHGGDGHESARRGNESARRRRHEPARRGHDGRAHLVLPHAPARQVGPCAADPGRFGGTPQGPGHAAGETAYRGLRTQRGRNPGSAVAAADLPADAAPVSTKRTTTAARSTKRASWKRHGGWKPTRISAWDAVWPWCRSRTARSGPGRRSAHCCAWRSTTAPIRPACCGR